MDFFFFFSCSRDGVFWKKSLAENKNSVRIIFVSLFLWKISLLKIWSFNDETTQIISFLKIKYVEISLSRKQIRTISFKNAFYLFTLTF